MNKIFIIPSYLEECDGFYTRSCKIVENNSEEILWFRFPSSITPPANDDCDSYLLAVLMDGMKKKLDIHVKGGVSKSLLINLDEYQAIWNKWCPKEYSIIKITVDFFQEENVSARGNVCAFSGGLDSTFSVWRHTQKKSAYRNFKINYCSLIHGFDIPLKDTLAFEKVFSNSSKTLADIGLTLVPIHTNYREISKAKWEHSHASALVAVFSILKATASGCLIGSSYPYSYLNFPWGSTPINDYLLSSESFNVIHDGASHTRTEKTNEIIDWQTGIENLRVCWQGKEKSGNCGVCEKCIRTKLNFKACGTDFPSCFPYADRQALDFSHIRLNAPGIKKDWQQIVDFAKNNNINAPWVKKAEQLINQKSLLDHLLPKGSKMRKLVSKLKN